MGTMPASSSPVEITERLLNDAGGWQTFKQARSLQEMGRVRGVTWEPPLLQGNVREGEREFRSGLRILSRTNIENLCSCRPAKQFGTICAHAIAVGLEHLRPTVFTAPSTPADQLTRGAEAIEKPPAAPTSDAKPAFDLAEGEPVELRVVFPPNLAAAWQKGSIMLGLEAIWGGKRVMFPALPTAGKYRASEQDCRLLQHLRQVAGEAAPGLLMLSRAQAAAVFTLLRGHSGVTMGKAQKVTVHEDSLQPELHLESLPEGRLRLRVPQPAGALPLFGGGQPWLLFGNGLQVWAAGLPLPYQPLLEEARTLPAEQAAGFLQKELPVLRSFFQIDEASLPAVEAALPKAPAVAFALELEGSLNFLVGKLTAIYGDHRLVLLDPPARSTLSRDLAAEHASAERLRAGGFAGPDRDGQFVLKGEQRILSFFARDLPAWERLAKVTIGSRFAHVTRDIERVQPRLEIRSSGENWFDLQVELSSANGERYSANEIQRLLQSGQSHVRRSNGKVAVFNPAMLEEFQQVLADCEASQRQPGLYKVDQRNAGYLQAVASDHGVELKSPPQWRETLSRVTDLAKLEPIPLGSLDTTLRDYQKQGVFWMNTLARNGFGGILADEMGLGKTVQTLATLRHLRGKSLIVCPSSLVYNWVREAGRFTPEQVTLAVEGPHRRPLFGEPLTEADVVVTSYALLRRDADLYRGTRFQTVVLDEAQHIKNPESQNAQAAFGVQAQHRFALTGTPVENSVRDIWSLMNFLMPGYLGSRNDFRDRYEVPIASAPGGPEHARLVKRLRPFLLRRRKADVLQELPSKIEQVTYCELGLQQRELYQALLSTARRQASEADGTKDQNKARMQVLTALLRLRQACCDMRLLQPDAEGGQEELSGKLESLGELLQEAVDGEHRVLIFSQFVGMLKILKTFLEQSDLGYCYLDGSTKDRAAQVDRFQTGEVPVFLISLKAGGVGLNLTAADTVIHFDPWWNPAVEAQATDRAHRIGQKKSVTSYKLITRNTIEEKILSLQRKKRQVIEATLESEEPLMQGLSMSELQELLE